MATGTGGPVEPQALSDQGECPRCGSATSPQQEYCLECGARLPALEQPAQGRAGRLRTGARDSLLTITASFVVAAIAAAALVAVQASGGDAEQPFLTATAPQQAEEELEPVETALPPTEEEPVEGEEPPAEEEPEPQPPAQPPQLITWPDGTDGWTVILASIPTGGGRGPATARARQALDAGLPEVGVLVSADFASLHPGYLNVFSGVYGTQAEAEAALPAVRAAGYPDAYPRRITP